MTQRKISIRRLFHDYCEVIQRSQPGACPFCGAMAALSEYGSICLTGHLIDDRGMLPISRTADLALAIVPAVRRNAGQTTDLSEAQKRYATPAYATLSDLIQQIEARGWLWECGHNQGPSEPERRYYARLWLPTLDPMHEDYADERIGWGATVEDAMQRAIAALPPDPYRREP